MDGRTDGGTYRSRNVRFTRSDCHEMSSVVHFTVDANKAIDGHLRLFVSQLLARIIYLVENTNRHMYLFSTRKKSRY